MTNGNRFPIPDPLILYDGLCNLCTAAVRFVIHHDRQGLFHFAQIQSNLGQEIFRSHGLDPEEIRTFLVFSGGRVFLRSDAAIEVARHLGGLWRWLALLRVVPRPWRDWGYRVIARNRYRWFGRCEACPIPSDEMRGRFVE